MADHKTSKNKRSLFDVKKEMDAARKDDGKPAELFDERQVDSDWPEMFPDSDIEEQTPSMPPAPKKTRTTTGVKVVVKTHSPIKERKSPKKTAQKKRSVSTPVY